MAKYYCDYCDIFLTHDTMAVRKAHNSGWKHAAAVKDYYSGLGQDTTQTVIDRITGIYSGGRQPGPQNNGPANPNQSFPPQAMYQK